MYDRLQCRASLSRTASIFLVFTHTTTWFSCFSTTSWPTVLTYMSFPMLRATGGGIELFEGIFLTLQRGLALLHSRVRVALIRPVVNILQGAGAGDVHPWIAMTTSRRQNVADIFLPISNLLKMATANGKQRRLNSLQRLPPNT